MANSSVVIPAEISKVVEERVALWQQLEKAQSQFSEIDKMGSSVVSSTPAEIESELKSVGTPPAEIAAALHNLKKELNKITAAEDDIKKHHNEIRDIQSFWTIVIVAVVVATIIGLWILSGALA
jgi:succinate dehydrogenase/fumarate reductase flavoprotein subunit